MATPEDQGGAVVRRVTPGGSELFLKRTTVVTDQWVENPAEATRMMFRTAQRVVADKAAALPQSTFGVVLG